MDLLLNLRRRMKLLGLIGQASISNEQADIIL
jgi:hypothetical protein